MRTRRRRQRRGSGRRGLLPFLALLLVALVVSWRVGWLEGPLDQARTLLSTFASRGEGDGGAGSNSSADRFEDYSVMPPATLEDAYTGWYTADRGVSYYWYDNGMRQATAGWKLTDETPEGDVGELKRYWLDADGRLAMGRLIAPDEGGDADYWAYATADGSIAVGWYADGHGKVYLADEDGRLVDPGWVVSDAYGQGIQRYYVEASTHSCVVGYSSEGWPHYTTEQGYVLRGALRVGQNVYLADEDGRLAESGWVDSDAYGQGMRRYYVEASTHSAVVGYSTEGWPHYTTDEGYVLQSGTLEVGTDTFEADDEGRIISMTDTPNRLYQTSTERRTYPDYAHWLGEESQFSAPELADVCLSYPSLLSYSNLDAFAVPGLMQTNLGTDYCDVMVPQGICATSKYLVISAYCAGGSLVSALQGDTLRTQGGNEALLDELTANAVHAHGDDTHPSVLFVLDKEDGSYRKTLVLTGLPSEARHVGGIACDGSNLWIATSTYTMAGELCEARIPLTTLDASVADPGDAVRLGGDQIELVALDGSVGRMQEASFNTWYDDRLWVGDFYEGILACFAVDTSGDATTFSWEGSYHMPAETQGATFAEAGGRTYLLLNSSQGRRNISRSYLYDVTDGVRSLAISGARTLWLPPLLEESCVDDGRIYTLFESGSTYYSSVDNASAHMRASTSIDQVCVGSVASVIAAPSLRPSMSGSAYPTKVILPTSYDVRVYDQSGVLVCVARNGKVDKDLVGVSASLQFSDDTMTIGLSEDLSYTLHVEKGEGKASSKVDAMVATYDEGGEVVSSYPLGRDVLKSESFDLKIASALSADSLDERVDVSVQ